MNFSINKEFQDLIPPLSAEEMVGLEQSVLSDECREPLIVWNNTIIDGHHRYTICCKHDIPFETRQIKGIESELDVKLWMINNQFSRRNLSTSTRLELAYRFKEFEAEKAKSRQGVRNDLIKDNTNISPPVGLSETDIIQSSREPPYRDSLSHHRTSDVAYGGFAVMFTKS